jgi:hypothetical protein
MASELLQSCRGSSKALVLVADDQEDFLKIAAISSRQRTMTVMKDRQARSSSRSSAISK